MVLVTLTGIAFAADEPEMKPVAGVDFKVRVARPRIWIRADEWKGPNVPKMKEWFKTAEYKKRGVGGNRVLQWVVNGDRAAGKAAISQLVRMGIGGGSPSYQGANGQKMAAYYDWLRNHPDFSEAQRKQVIAKLEKAGDYFLRYRGTPIYYSRYPGSIGGVVCIGLALHGDSPKADKLIAGGYKLFVEYGKCREYEDGASAGGSYSTYHSFPALARAAIAYESATDANVLPFIKEKQSNWLERQLLWQIWWTKPNGYFVKEGDLFQQPDRRQAKFQVDQLTHILHNGYGQAHAELMKKRWGTGDYHRNYMWEWHVFHNPEVEAKPLDGLGKAELFGRESHGYVIFRDGWDKGLGNTHIFFRCGEGLDVHSNRGAGAFDIFRHRTLAERANKDYPKDGRDDHIKYSNVVIFNGRDHRKTEMKNNMPVSFKRMLTEKKRKGFELASIVDYEVKDDYARVKGDISAAVKQDCELWTRELVYLGYKYLLVLDRVKTKATPTKQQWQLHFCAEPTVADKTAFAVVGPGKLFCRTLLPKEIAVSGEKAGKGYFRHMVSPKDDSQREVTYLHVLYPTEATTKAMPETSVVEAADGKKLTVTVGDLAYTFGE
jgi:hypothetical protein